MPGVVGANAKPGKFVLDTAKGRVLTDLFSNDLGCLVFGLSSAGGCHGGGGIGPAPGLVAVGSAHQQVS